MAYIRMNQEGEYIDIPYGSNEYIYDNGRDIGGWSYGQFAALIGQVADEVDIHEIYRTDIKAAFRRHFEGWDPDYSGGLNPPERGEIFCQCVDSRISGRELTDGLHEAVKEWAEEDFDALRECEYCGTEIRPHFYNDDTAYVCNDEECEILSEADSYGVSPRVMRNTYQLECALVDYGYSWGNAYDESWDYLVEHSEKLHD